jgi:hypothetical protein
MTHATMSPRPRVLVVALLSALTVTAVSLPHASAQDMPSCTGSDVDGAAQEFEQGNALMQQALGEVRRHLERARVIAGEALQHFDRQCELGDTGALAERGAALMLMGQLLRSAQSFDAFLFLHPIETLDARTRRRIESNLQPGTLRVTFTNRSEGRLFIDDLDFGLLPRATDVHVPYGSHEVEARDATGTVLAHATVVLDAGSSVADALLAAPELTPVVVPVQQVTTPTPTPTSTPHPQPAAQRQDFLAYYIAAGAAAAVGVGLGIGGLLGADDRAQTWNTYCLDGGYSGCDSVLSERDTDLGLAVAGFVVGGLGVAGIAIVAVMDASQSPRTPMRVSFSPFGVSLSGEF